MENIYIVEGKTDANKLLSIYKNLKIIITNGIKISKSTLNIIEQLSKNNKIYIFTDPDYAGKLIRNKIANLLNKNCFHIYIPKKENQKKYGVAQANKEDIKLAMENTLQINDQKNNNYFSFQKYLSLELNSKKIRIYIANKLKITYFNHKNFYKILTYLNIKFEDIKKYKNEYYLGQTNEKAKILL